jgi:hypothetical protein
LDSERKVLHDEVVAEAKDRMLKENPKLNSEELATKIRQSVGRQADSLIEHQKGMDVEPVMSPEIKNPTQLITEKPKKKILIRQRKIRKYGTSEGAVRAWDSRGRGQKEDDTPKVKTSFKELKEEYNSQSNPTPFVKNNIILTAYRVGEVKDSFNRGIFFSSDKEGAQSYAALHPGQSVEEYNIDLSSALIAGHQNSVSKMFFNRSYGDMIDSFGGGPEAARKLDRKIKKELEKRKLSGLIYTSPAPPADMECMIVDPDSAKKIISLSSQKTNSDIKKIRIVIRRRKNK